MKLFCCLHIFEERNGHAEGTGLPHKLSVFHYDLVGHIPEKQEGSL